MSNSNYKTYCVINKFKCFKDAEEPKDVELSLFAAVNATSSEDIKTSLENNMENYWNIVFNNKLQDGVSWSDYINCEYNTTALNNNVIYQDEITKP